MIGHLLGALPVDQSIGRRSQGVDMFSRGSTLGGTANVFCNVGRGSGLRVCAGYSVMLGLSLPYNLEPNISRSIEIELVSGLTVLAGLVLIRSMIARRRHDAALIAGTQDELPLA